MCDQLFDVKEGGKSVKCNFIITNTKKYKLKPYDILVSGQKCISINNKLIDNLEDTLSKTQDINSKLAKLKLAFIRNNSEEIENQIELTLNEMKKYKVSPDSLYTKINRLKRINCMISHCKGDIIMTKFVDNIWPKYSFFSRLGEQFLAFEDMKSFFPYLEERELITEKSLEKDYKYF